VLLAMPERHRFIRGMVSWIGFRQEPLLYDRDPRYAGHTKYTLGKMLRFALDAVTGFSIKPLALVSWAGSGAAFLGFILGFLAVGSWLSGGSAGGLGLAALMALLAGVEMLALGIIGEYLGRLYEQSKGRPLFVIDRVLGHRHGAAQPAASSPHLGSAPETRPSLAA
jgi:dolichol-phosphate mannosyltransferase